MAKKDTKAPTPSAEAGPSKSASDSVSGMSGSTLIKSLKAAQDPPTASGPSKIELAAAAWADASLVVPRKADVVRDWIVEAWSRVKPGPFNPILSPAYHRLLVTVTPACAAPAAAPLSLLNTYIASCKAAATAKDVKFDLASLPSAADASFALLFNETKAEAWAEMWGAVVTALAAVPGNSEAARALVPAVDLVCGALIIALPTSPNAKKVAAGLHATLPAFAKASAAHDLTPLADLTPLLFFPVPTLQTVDPLKALLAPLATSTAPADLRLAVGLIPHLFDAFVSSTIKNRYTLYGKANTDRPIDVIVADRVRGAVIPALGAALELANKVEDSTTGLADAVWAARLRLWQSLVAWGGYLETEARAGELVANEARRAAAALAAYGAAEANATDEGLAGKILRTLDALEQLDHERANVDTTVVGWCLASPPRTHAATRALLTSVLRFHQLTHTLSQFMDLVADAATGLFDPVLPAPTLAAVYTLVASGPLSDKAFTDALAAAVRSTNLGGRRSAQWAGMLDDIGRRARTALSGSEAVGGKRKRASIADAPAALIGELSRLASVILSAGARAKAGDEDVEYAVGAIARAFVPENEDEEDSSSKKSKKHHDRLTDIVTAARLRIARAAMLVHGTEVETGTPLVTAIVSGCSGELSVAAFRFLLTNLALRAHGDDESRSESVDAALAMLSTPGDKAWTGRDATVTTYSLAAACWTILAQNGVAVLDATATQAQLDTLSTLVVSRAAAPEAGFTVSAALTRLLSTADTWELVSFRNALLRALAANTGGGTFAVLSASPAAWLSKGTRSALLEAAYAAKSSSEKGAIRAWLARLAVNGVLGPLDVEKLESVLKKADGAEEQTLALAKAAIPHLIRSSLPALLDMASSAVKKDKKDKAGDVRARAVPLLLSALAAQSLDKFAAERTRLDALEAAARKALQPRADAALADITSPTATPTLEAYRTLNAYTRWLGGEDSTDVGARLVALVLKNADSNMAVIALDLVPAASALAAFLVLSAAHSSPALDDAFKARSRTVSAETYAEWFTSLVERASARSPPARATALGAARILLSAPVEGSGKAVAASLGALLGAVDAAVRVPQVRVVEEALAVLNALVDERTGLLRANDAGQILATLTAALLPSSAPATAPAPHLLPLAINPVLTLARHRPDLVLAHLPSIVSALCAVVPLLQRARSKAGRNRLAARRPFWLTADPTTSVDLAPEHAALLARALVALCTARIAPATGSNSLQGKSLAGPLGKHAPAVLVAYARAAADPWAALSPAVRRALEPGLFAVCDVVTQGGRADGRGREGEGVGAPFGLDRDESEREVWAEMWRGWGRRRYTGLG